METFLTELWRHNWIYLQYILFVFYFPPSTAHWVHFLCINHSQNLREIRKKTIEPQIFFFWLIISSSIFLFHLHSESTFDFSSIFLPISSKLDVSLTLKKNLPRWGIEPWLPGWKSDDHSTIPTQPYLESKGNTALFI